MNTNEQYDPSKTDENDGSFLAFIVLGGMYSIYHAVTTGVTIVLGAFLALCAICVALLLVLLTAEVLVNTVGVVLLSVLTAIGGLLSAYFIGRNT
jgi:hypothetical protein